MPQFSFEPLDHRPPVPDLHSENNGHILIAMDRAQCRHAHVYQDGAYFISARRVEGEFWSLYDREKPMGQTAGVTAG